MVEHTHFSEDGALLESIIVEWVTQMGMNGSVLNFKL